ncbi:MAG: NADH-quinone oxidoreductase subunit J [Acidimicrobiales bacterium]
MDLVAQNIAFFIVAAVILVSAWRVVSTHDIMHAALWLTLVLASVGVLYLLAGAEFVATTQYLVYIGAIVVLFLFGIMLTRDRLSAIESAPQAQTGVAIGTAVLLAAVMIFALVDSFEDVGLEEGAAALGIDDEQAQPLNGVGDLLDDPDTDLVLLAARLDVDISDAVDGDDVDEDAVRRAIADEYPSTNTQVIGDSIFGRYIIPFEALSVLLLAALIGAIVLARKE